MVFIHNWYQYWLNIEGRVDITNNAYKEYIQMHILWKTLEIREDITNLFMNIIGYKACGSVVPFIYTFLKFHNGACHLANIAGMELLSWWPVL